MRFRQSLSRLALLGFAGGLVLIASVGCRSERRAGSPAPVTSPGQPRFVDPATGQLLTGPDAEIDFGRVRLHDAERRELRIHNDGLATFTVTAVQPAPNHFPREAFVWSSVPFEVRPGSEATFAITFRPMQPCEVSGSLALPVANAEPGTLQVRLRAVGYRDDSPDLEIDPQPLELDFGDSPGTLFLTLTNVGADVPGTTADNLRLGVLGPDGGWDERVPAITGPDAAAFSFVWPAPGYGPDGLAEGETASLPIHFAPSCRGLKAAILVVSSNDPHRPEVRIPMFGFGPDSISCELQLSPATVEFGVVEPGTSLTRVVLLENRDPLGTGLARRIAWLDLAEDSSAGRCFELVDGPVVDRPIALGETLSIPVRFSPDHEGACRGELVVKTADPFEQRAALRGFGSASCLVLAPRELDFGIVAVDCSSRQRTLTLYNSCASALSVASITLQPETSGGFQITRRPALPTPLAPRAQLDFNISYHPAQVAEDSAVVAVTAADLPDPLLAHITGSSATVVVQTDRFSAGLPPKLDVLFVIDNSPAMADKQVALARNFAAFIHWFAGQPTDFHIAVTTSDVTATGEAGRFVPLSGTRPQILTSSTPNLEAVFLENVAVGSSGSASPAPLRASYLTLSEPLSSGENRGFLRSDASLAIIAVTASADHDPLATPVADYEDFLARLKGLQRVREVTVSGVIPQYSSDPDPSDGCTYSDPSAGQDPRIRLLITRTGGSAADICDPNWSTALESAAASPGSRSPFCLTSIPDMSVTPLPVVVSVNGQPLPQYDGNVECWEYLEPSRCVEIHDACAPDARATVAVTYPSACR